MEIRPMQRADVAAVVDVCAATLWEAVPDALRPKQAVRVAHLLETDPAGAWVSEHAGRVTGVAMALVRDGVWGLSLLAILDEHRGRGAGRELLAPALAYAGGARGGIVLSSTHPAAMRLYARAGFALRPCVSLAGHVRRPPAPRSAVRDGSEADFAWIDDVARATRGAPYSRDIPALLAVGVTLRTVEGRGFLLARGGELKLAAAIDDEAAVWLIEDLLARAGGERVSVEFLTSGQDWAIQAGLAAGLALSPDGPVFTRGELGSLRPWVPSGAYL